MQTLCLYCGHKSFVFIPLLTRIISGAPYQIGVVHLFFFSKYIYFSVAAVERKQKKSREVAVPEQSQEPENPSSRASNAEEFKQTELLMILLSLSLLPSLNNGTSVRHPRGEVMESWISKQKPLGGPQGGTRGSVGKQRSIFSFLFLEFFFLHRRKKSWGVEGSRT